MAKNTEKRIRKIKLKVSPLVYSQLQMDKEDFNIRSVSALYNMIFDRWVEDVPRLYKNHTLGDSVTELEIQFTLGARENLKYEEAYKNFSYDSNELATVPGTAEVARFLFTRYVQQARCFREEFVKANEVHQLKQAIAQKRRVRLSYREVRLEAEPCFIAYSEGLARAYLVAFHDSFADRFRCFRLAHLSDVQSLSGMKASHWENRNLKNKSLELQKHFDPFLSYGHLVKVRLSPAGVAYLQRAVTNRPKWDESKVHDDIYTFQCSPFQAKLYFAAFLDDAEILEPIELRTWFAERMRKAVDLYKA